MKVGAFFTALVLAVVPGSTFAQFPNSSISLYSDPEYTSREALDRAPGTLTVFVVHEYATGAYAAAFKIGPSAGFAGVWLSESSSFFVAGASPTGVQVAYQSCVGATVLVLEVIYTVFGTSEDCSYLEVLAHPDFDYGGPFVTDCGFESHVVQGGRLTINPTPSCSPIPVEPSTWGQVKALYR